MDSLLSGLSVSVPESGVLDPVSLIPNKKEYWLEIGFGGGEHLAHQGGLHKDAGIIGCEPYIHGIAALLKHIDDNKLDNIRIYQQDARLLLDALLPQSISRAFILYPDPWPKARHHKRRLVSKPTLDALARVMKKGAELRLASDDEDYCTWMLEQLQAHDAFTWTAKSCNDWLNPWGDWLSTRYEQKALAAGRVPTYLIFRRSA
jgi:tRNA (guanine-N7-)-methyltransferase